MNQSAIIAAAIFAAFGLFVASRERLPVYARVLWGDKPGTQARGEQQESGEDDGDLFPDWTLPGTIENMTDSDVGKVLNDIYKSWDN